MKPIETLIASIDKVISSLVAITVAENAVDQAEAAMDRTDEDDGTSDPGELYDREQAAGRDLAISKMVAARANKTFTKSKVAFAQATAICIPQVVASLEERKTERMQKLRDSFEPLVHKDGSNEDGHRLLAMEGFINSCTGVSNIARAVHWLVYTSQIAFTVDSMRSLKDSLTQMGGPIPLL